MRRALVLWTAGWLLIGVVDLALGIVNGAPDVVLALAALTVLLFIVVGDFVIAFVYGSSRIIDRTSERTLAATAVVILLVGGLGIILLPGVTIVACVALGLFALGFGAMRLAPALMSGRTRGKRPDEQAAVRNARRDAVFASIATQSGDAAPEGEGGGGMEA
jgi:hypothetical protein